MLKLDPKNTELLAQKQSVLNKNIETTEDKLKQLQEIKNKADIAMAKGTKISEENYRSLQREIINTQNKLSDLKNEASNWTKAGNYLNKVGDELDKIGKKINDLGNKLTTRLSLPIVAGLGAAVNSSIEFESAFAGVEKTVDGTTQQMENLKQGIKDLSKEIPSTTTEISKVAEAAGQLGIQTDNVLSFTKTMIDLGNSTNLSAEEAATTLARFANVTKMNQKDFDKLGSVIVALGNNFATTEAEIASMGMNLGSAGTQVGMTQSEIMALATALSSVGLEAQAGGTAFSKVMINMQLAVEKGGKDLKNFATVAGMSSKEFAKAFKEDATGAITSFVDGLSKSGERGKSAIKILDDMGITEVRLRDALLRSANASDIMNNAIKLGNEAWEENTALVNEANKRYETTESQIAIAKNQIKDISVSLGNKLIPVAKKLLKKIDEWTDKFNKLSDEEQENIVKIGLMVAAAGPLLKIGGNAISIMGNVSKGLGTLSKAISLAHNGIGTATGSAATLAKVLQGLSSPMGLAAVGITASVALIVNAMNDLQKDAKEAFSNMGNSASDFISGIDSAQSHLGAFNSELFVSSQEQKELEEQMQEVQEGITKICKTASEERRNYTQEEVTQLDEYFEKLRELNQREIEIQQSIAGAITQQATQNAATFKGTLEEYKVQSQEWLKTAEEQKNKTLELVNSQTIEEVALLNTRYSTEDARQTEAYRLEYEKIMQQKEEKIAAANDEIAKINQAYSNGYLERSKENDGFYDKLKEFTDKQERLQEAHNKKIEQIKNDELWYVTDKNGEIRNENEIFAFHQQDIWNKLYKDMDKSQEEQLGTWLAMVAQTEMYGGEIDEETRKTVDSILASYNSMPKGTKEAMKNAMEPMLEEMQNKEPSLFAKATGIADGILTRLKKSFDIHSPSRKTRDIFQNVMKGAELGLEDEKGRLNKEIENIASQIQTDFNNIVPNMQGIKQSVIDKTKTVFTTPNIVFNVQKMDEANLNTAFNYVNKRLGSQY